MFSCKFYTLNMVSKILLEIVANVSEKKSFLLFGYVHVSGNIWKSKQNEVFQIQNCIKPKKTKKNEQKDLVWKTRNIRSLFNLKDKANHVSSVVYEGKCNCGENYIGETGRNVTKRWDEHVT